VHSFKLITSFLNTYLFSHLSHTPISSFYCLDFNIILIFLFLLEKYLLLKENLMSVLNLLQFMFHILLKFSFNFFFCFQFLFSFFLSFNLSFFLLLTCEYTVWATSSPHPPFPDRTLLFSDFVKEKT
jgi:hypothetical protein